MSENWVVILHDLKKSTEPIERKSAPEGAMKFLLLTAHTDCGFFPAGHRFPEPFIAIPLMAAPA